MRLHIVIWGACHHNPNTYMFIVWGKKTVYRKIGHVADFCSICREPRPFKLRRVGSAGHLYYISVGEGELVGYERSCHECGTTFPAQVTTYATVSKSPAPLEDLLNRTFPKLREFYQQRLVLEEAIRHDPAALSQDQRHSLIRAAFVFLSPQVEQRFAATHIDKEITLSMVTAVALAIFAPLVVKAWMPDAPESSRPIFVIIGLLLVGWQIAVSGRRFMRRHIIPGLAKALDPLSPTEDEIQTVMAELKQHRHKIGRKLRLADLQARMRRKPAAAT